MSALKKLVVRVGEDPLPLTLNGRVAWAMGQLIEAGETGCTPIRNPAPRWSGYVHRLRRAGVPVETIDEAHDGPYSGRHARYVLTAPVAVIGELRHG